MKQNLPGPPGDDQTDSRSRHHRAVVSALMETKGDKIREAAQVAFPDGSEQEGSIWHMRAGWYSALVGGVWWLLEFWGDDDQRDPPAIERWVVRRDAGGRPMLAQSM